MRAQQKIWFWSGLTTYTFATCLCLRMALWWFLLPYLIRLNWFRFIDRVSPIQTDSSVRGSCLSWYSVDTNHESIRRWHTPRLTVYPCKCSFWVKSGFATRVYMNKSRMAFEWADQRRNPDRERTIGRYWKRSVKGKWARFCTRSLCNVVTCTAFSFWFDTRNERRVTNNTRSVWYMEC
jgi:hypothetical protein